MKCNVTSKGGKFTVTSPDGPVGTFDDVNAAFAAGVAWEQAHVEKAPSKPINCIVDYRGKLVVYGTDREVAGNFGLLELSGLQFDFLLTHLDEVKKFREEHRSKITDRWQDHGKALPKGDPARVNRVGGKIVSTE